MKTVFVPALAAMSFAAMAGAAQAEDVVFKGKVTDVFGDRAVVDAGDKKYLVNFGPKVREQNILKSGDAIEIDGDLKKSGEVRAHNITLADGRKVEVGKDKTTWKEWLLGDDKDDDKPFTAADAKKVAAEKGYALTSEPEGEKKHFTALATKDGKAVEVEIHRDGDIKEQAVFTAENAKSAITAKGYEIVGGPEPMKKHFEALTRKNSEYFEVHARRGGDVKEARKVTKDDPRWGKLIP